MEYEAEVLSACEKYDLDPCLVFAVIRTESFYSGCRIGCGRTGIDADHARNGRMDRMAAEGKYV